MSEEKTEAATPRKLQHLRDEGRVSKSTEVASAAGILGSVITLYALGGASWTQMRVLLSERLVDFSRPDLTDTAVLDLAMNAGIAFFAILAPLLIAMPLVGIIANVAQSGFLVSGKQVTPDFSRINPLDGAKRLFSLRILVELLKTTIKLGIVGWLLYRAYLDSFPIFLSLAGADLAGALGLFVDTAADNLSKLQVAGGKSQRASFAEMAPELTYLGVPDGEGNVQIDARETGTGVRVSGTLQNLSRGEFQRTDNPLDVAIDGDGFLEVTIQNGQTAYTRTGTLQVDGQGRLVTSAGFLVSPTIQVPTGIDNLQIDKDGTVSAIRQGADTQVIGKLKLVRFENPEGLQLVGDTALLATIASGAPIAANAGAPGVGTVVSGVLEMSNVDSGEEYLRVVQAQRAYELNVRALKTMDEMLQDAQNLRRQ
jgi:flagellar basal-body rod protein FlgG